MLGLQNFNPHSKKGEMLLAGKGIELLPLQRRKPQQYRLELERGLAYLMLTSTEV